MSPRESRRRRSTARTVSSAGSTLAYRYLNRRDRTEAEVRAATWTARGSPPADAEQAVATLRDQGYVDDARYARLLAEDKRNLEGWGASGSARTLARAESTGS